MTIIKGNQMRHSTYRYGERGTEATAIEELALVKAIEELGLAMSSGIALTAATAAASALVTVQGALKTT